MFFPFTNLRSQASVPVVQMPPVRRPATPPPPSAAPSFSFSADSLTSAADQLEFRRLQHRFCNIQEELARERENVTRERETLELERRANAATVAFLEEQIAVYRRELAEARGGSSSGGL